MICKGEAKILLKIVQKLGTKRMDLVSKAFCLVPNNCIKFLERCTHICSVDINNILIYSFNPVKIMALKYKIVKMGNPIDRTKPKKYYVKAVHIDQEVCIKSLSIMVKRGSLLKQTEIEYVLTEACEQMLVCFSNGRKVRLGKLGLFAVSLKSKGADSAKMVKSGKKVSRRIIYRASPELKAELQELEIYRDSLPDMPDEKLPEEEQVSSE